MAFLVCPNCQTVHRVSVLQTGYRQLPCRHCRVPIRIQRLEDATLAQIARDPLLATGFALQRPFEEESSDDDETGSRPALFALSESVPVLAVLAEPGARPKAESEHRDAPGELADERPRCPRCDGTIQPGAVKCPHCKSFLAADQSRQRDSVAQRLWWGIGIATAAIAVLLVLLLLRSERPL